MQFKQSEDCGDVKGRGRHQFIGSMEESVWWLMDSQWRRKDHGHQGHGALTRGTRVVVATKDFGHGDQNSKQWFGHRRGRRQFEWGRIVMDLAMGSSHGVSAWAWHGTAKGWLDKEFAMLLDTLEPQGWSSAGCLVGVVRGVMVRHEMAQSWHNIGGLGKLDIWHGGGSPRYMC